MRLLTFEAAGRSRLGAEWQGRVVDLQNVAALVQLVQYGAAAAQELTERFPSDMLSYLKGGAAILGAVVPTASLTNKVATGGRLNCSGF